MNMPYADLMTLLAGLAGVLIIASLAGFILQKRLSPDGSNAVIENLNDRIGAWWAMVILVCVDGTVFASLVFAHVHVSMAAEVCPPPGASLPHWGWSVASAALLLAGSAAMAGSQAMLGKVRKTGVWLLVLLAMPCLLAAFGLDGWGHHLAGLRPTVNAWSATVAALLAWQGFHVAVLAVMGGYVCARSWAGRLRGDARSSLDNTVVLWHYVTGQGLAGMGIIYLMPVI